uniref:tetratricopeptide repeat protein 9B-like n=1 Tax=Myxine glutinosa TaxID=7769 RepID=UPI00358DE7E1
MTDGMPALAGPSSGLVNLSTKTPVPGSSSGAAAHVALASAFEAEGNRCYKDKKFREAIGKYHRALLQLKAVPRAADLGRGEERQVHDRYQGSNPESVLSAELLDAAEGVEVDCYISLAACLLQSELVNYERVRDYCLKVLQHRTDNFKALYRAGVAYYHLGDLTNALSYLQQAGTCQPHDLNVKRYTQLTEMRMSRSQQPQRDVRTSDQ